MSEYNPSAVGIKGTIFGYPYSIEQADLVLLPVPWDVTVSYGAGTANAPELLREESSQLDFSIPHINDVHTYPVAMDAMDEELHRLSIANRSEAEGLIASLEESGELTPEEQKVQTEINARCTQMIANVRKRATAFLSKGKVVASVGGDHSTPLGLLQAVAEQHDSFGILQIDAHMDLRNSYEGFTYSHASIMFNALNLPQITKLVQVGIRDYCEEEVEVVKEMEGRVAVYFDEHIQRQKWAGISWIDLANKIVAELPEKVYVSFDMDGLDPSMCPNTGTPVAGGLQFVETVYLLEEIVRSGRTLIGFDVSECGNDSWDANVASRILLRLCAITGISRGKLFLSE
jgi:agmatinase